MEVKLDGVAQIFAELRILWINKDISPHALFLYLIILVALWNLPATLRALNDRKRIHANAALRGKLLERKLGAESERRGRRPKK